MVDISSFLTEGAEIPQGSALKATQSQTILPEWYTNYAMQLLADQQAVAARPYTTAPMPRVAEFSPTQQQAFNMTGTAATSYQPNLGLATQATQGAMAAPGALATAMPFINRAGATAVDNIGAYMNPYTDAVVNRIADLGVRNLNENIMPGIEGRYIAAGQLGFGGREGGMGTPSGMMTDTARAVRDVSADILGQQTQALQQGYTQALGAAQGDLSRFGQLGSTAGGLATQDVNQQLAGAQQLAGLGAMEQQLGLTGAGALGQVGAQQQTQAQRNLDVAYEDFLRQQGYDQNQINAALNTFKTIASGVPTATSDIGLVPTGQPAEYEPSTAASIGSALTGLGGVLAALKGL